MIRTTYLKDVYEPARFCKAVKQATKEITKLQKKLKFDSIAFTGHSGSAFAYAVSAMTGIPLTCVRKKGSKSHFGGTRGGVEGMIPKTYIIVDDFIETGSTIKNIIDSITAHQKSYYDFDYEPKCVGIYLYSSSTDRVAFEGIPVFKRKYSRGI